MPMSRPSITTLPSLPSARCRSRITSRTSWWRATTGTSLSMSGLRIEDVTSLPSMKTRPCLVEADRVLGRERGQLVGEVERDAAAPRQPGQRAVHRPRVEVAEAEPLGEYAVRPCSCRPLRARRWQRSSGGGALCSESRRSKKPGKLTAAASAPSTSTPSRETRPAIAPSIAIRWSPRASNVPPPRIRDGTPRTVNPSGVARMWAPRLRRPSTTASIRSVSFARSSAAPRSDAVAVGVHREQREERQLVDQQRHLGRADRRRRRARTGGRRGRRPARRRSAAG